MHVHYRQRAGKIEISDSRKELKTEEFKKGI